MSITILQKAKQVERNFLKSTAFKLLIAAYVVAIVGGLVITLRQKYTDEQAMIAVVSGTEARITELTAAAQQFEQLKSEDQVIKNATLSAQITAIESTYTKGATLFEQRADLTVTGAKTKDIDLALAKFLNLLGKKDYDSASTQIGTIQKLINKVIADTIPSPLPVPGISVAQSATSNNSLPGSGYARQKVSTSRGDFVVSLIVAPGARAVVETASDSDCSDNCPTKSLADHIAASGGFAGINGSYFCPPDYASCQGKINTFDTLAVNGQTKAVLNRANNVYSVVPLVTMYGSKLTFYDRTLEWGIDTSSNGALANFPRLLRDGNVATSDQGKIGTKGFIGTRDGTIVIGHVYNAGYADEAEVLHTLGLQQAMNLDGGGSSALWYEGSYKVGPGRSLPTAIVLVH